MAFEFAMICEKDDEQFIRDVETNFPSVYKRESAGFLAPEVTITLIISAAGLTINIANFIFTHIVNKPKTLYKKRAVVGKNGEELDFSQKTEKEIYELLKSKYDN